VGVSVARPPTAEPVQVANSGTTILDNFNRVLPGPFWGTTPSGFEWFTFNTNNQCTGYTASMDGAAGIMTGALNAECIHGLGLDQHIGGAPAGELPWEANAWQFTGEFETTGLDGSDLDFSIHEQLFSNVVTRATMHLSATSGFVSLSGSGSTAPMSWLANTWYSVKWVVVWGDQARVKVWPMSGAEPTQWQLVGTAPIEQPNRTFAVIWDSPFGPTSVHVDDFIFGPAPILPKLPPPPGTEDNPPYLNGEAGGDPVSTFTGTYSDSHLDVAMPGRGPSIQAGGPTATTSASSTPTTGART
jgi:hypothetical protein